MVSAQERPETIAKYIAEELERGRLVEVPADKLEGIKVHLSLFGVIPKKSNHSKWRLILDLSVLEGHSVNDGTAKELASLHYVSVDEVEAYIVHQGRGSFLAKMDVNRNIPVHPEDSPLLGYEMDW